MNFWRSYLMNVNGQGSARKEEIQQISLHKRKKERNRKFNQCPKRLY